MRTEEQERNPVLERFTLLNLGAIMVGGVFAFAFLRPDLVAGPIRTGTYFIFALASLLMVRKLLTVVRHQGDGKANVFLISSTLFWGTFMFASAFIGYLVLSRAVGFSPHISEGMQTRISYFFITGSSIGALFTALVFNIVPVQSLLGRRVSAWPLSAGLVGTSDN